MAKQPETKFKEKVRRRLDAIPRSFWVKIQMVALRGIPDFIGVVNGRFVALELKVGSNKATKLQYFTLSKFAAAGAYTRVVYPENLDETIEHLTKIAEAA